MFLSGNTLPLSLSNVIWYGRQLEGERRNAIPLCPVRHLAALAGQTVGDQRRLVGTDYNAPSW